MADDDLELIVPYEMTAGQWADFYRVGDSRDGFTADFIRLDAFEPRGVVVARVGFSGRLLGDLAETLEDLWQTWSRDRMPPEVRGDDD